MENQAEAKAKTEAKAQRIDQMAKEKELKEAKMLAAKREFEDQDIHFEYDSSKLSSMAKCC